MSTHARNAGSREGARARETPAVALPDALPAATAPERLLHSPVLVDRDNYATQTGQLERCESDSPADREEFERFLRFVDEEHTDARLPLRAWLDLAEAWRITRALRSCRGNRSAAARELGIGRRTLYAKMDKLGIEPSWSVPTDGPVSSA